MDTKECRKCGLSLAQSSFRGKRGVCRECERAYDRERYSSSPEKRNQHVRAWRVSNVEAQREYYQRRRMVKETNPIAAELVKQRMLYFADVCWICHEKILKDELHYEHKKPIAAGGSHLLSNLAPAHALCNLVKGSRWYGIAGLERLLEEVRQRVAEIQSVVVDETEVSDERT